MPDFSTTRRVRHNASDMFDLVADVERYPEFLPLCSGMKLRSRKEQAEGKPPRAYRELFRAIREAADE